MHHTLGTFAHLRGLRGNLPSGKGRSSGDVGVSEDCLAPTKSRVWAGGNLAGVETYVARRPGDRSGAAYVSRTLSGRSAAPAGRMGGFLAFPDQLGQGRTGDDGAEGTLFCPRSSQSGVSTLASRSLPPPDPASLTVIQRRKITRNATPNRPLPGSHPRIQGLLHGLPRPTGRPRHSAADISRRGCAVGRSARLGVGGCGSVGSQQVETVGSV